LFTNGWKAKYDDDKWETPRTPLQWILKRKALIGGDGTPVVYEKVFDKNHLLRVVELHRDGKRHPTAGYLMKGAHLEEAVIKEAWKEQLTLNLELMEPDWSNLPDYMKCICAALMAYANKDKELCWTMLDQINMVWTPEIGEQFCKDENTQKLYKDIIGKYSNTPTSRHVYQVHGYWPGAYIGGMMDAAHDAGSIGTSEMLYLRYENIILFEILNARGGGVEWSNSVLVGSQIEHEDVLNHYIEEPMLKKAWAGTNRALYEEGWLDDLPEGISLVDEVSTSAGA
jgi:hypothetical protein